jgi:hypothetical protein
MKTQRPLIKSLSITWSCPTKVDRGKASSVNSLFLFQSHRRLIIQHAVDSLGAIKDFDVIKDCPSEVWIVSKGPD